MFIKLIGGNFDNCGDHLMLIAATAALRCFQPQPRIVTSILGQSTYEQRAFLGLYQTLPTAKRLSMFSTFGVPVLRRYGHLFGIIPDEKVDLFLDMSGYAYADRWGLEVIQNRFLYYQKLKRDGKKVVFLPQAFGPLEQTASKKLMAKLLALADLVFARDSFSYKQLLQINSSAKVRLAPEFTQVLNPMEGNVFSDCVAIVPNIQVIKQGSISEESYLSFWEKVILAIRCIGFRPLVVQFSQTADVPLVEEIHRRHHDIQVIRSSDPLKLKGAIATCRAAVCSRFHSFVSALSSGVPAATTAWSHKYVEFARDYEMEGFVLDVHADESHIKRVIRTLCCDRYEELSQKLVAFALELRQKIYEMWSTVARLANLDFPTNANISSPTGGYTTQ